MQCPICKKPVDEHDAGKPGSTFPFCSDRCRLIDLGRWLSGEYAIESTRDETEGADWDASNDDASDLRR
jgi:endogenous inhibitor of DNA gyrase (YacG/DUF329 family)